jgi:hypothetical protein
MPEPEWMVHIVGSKEFCQKVAAYADTLRANDLTTLTYPTPTTRP